MNNTIGSNYKAATKIFKDKKWTLCGLILLETVFSILAELFGILPIISLPICFAISVSAAAICLKGIRGENVDSKNLFDGFKNFKHNAGGMAWMSLWVYIWIIVPAIVLINIVLSSVGDVISAYMSYGSRYYGSSAMPAGSMVMICIAVVALLVGIVMMIIKSFTYCFTPYILMDKPEIHAMDAIKESKKLTAGIRGKIFWANVIPILILVAIDIVLAVFAMIPFIGVLFDVILTVVNLVSSVVLSIFLSLVLASFYNKATAPEAQEVVPAAPVIENPAPAPTPTPAPASAPAADETPKAE